MWAAAPRYTGTFTSGPLVQATACARIGCAADCAGYCLCRLVAVHTHKRTACAGIQLCTLIPDCAHSFQIVLASNCAHSFQLCTLILAAHTYSRLCTLIPDCAGYQSCTFNPAGHRPRCCRPCTLIPDCAGYWSCTLIPDGRRPRCCRPYAHSPADQATAVHLQRQVVAHAASRTHPHASMHRQGSAVDQSMHKGMHGRAWAYTGMHRSTQACMGMRRQTEACHACMGQWIRSGMYIVRGHARERAQGLSASDAACNSSAVIVQTAFCLML